MRLLLPVILLITAFISTTPLSPCTARATALETPQVDNSQYCLERVIDDASAGEMAFTALAAAPDGTLYATRPLTGEVFVITDTDQDGLPDTARMLIDGLTRPAALTFYEDALYLTGGPNLYRWTQAAGIETLVDELPAGTGFWTGGIAINPDEQRIYVGIGAACDRCPGEAARGSILSFDLDGSDRREVAVGIHQPAGMLWWQATLWFTDTSRDRLEGGSKDELNRILPDQIDSGLDYGFPYCVGIDQQPDSSSPEANCSQYMPPEFTFPTHSNPVSLTAYTGAAFPDLQDSLLIALSGSSNESRLRGYEVGIIRPATEGQSIRYETLVPMLENYNQQYQRLGFFPHRPYGVAVNPDGWIYISTGGGKIYVLRPL